MWDEMILLSPEYLKDVEGVKKDILIASFPNSKPTGNGGFFLKPQDALQLSKASCRAKELLCARTWMPHRKANSVLAEENRLEYSRSPSA